MRQNLITARLDKGLTQKELGGMIALSMQSISALERGRIEGRARTWDALEDILGVPQRTLREQVDSS